MDTARAFAPPLPQGPTSPQEQIAALQVENQKLWDQVQQLQTGKHSFQEQATALGGIVGNHSASVMTPVWATSPSVPLPEL